MGDRLFGATVGEPLGEAAQPDRPPPEVGDLRVPGDDGEQLGHRLIWPLGVIEGQSAEDAYGIGAGELRARAVEYRQRLVQLAEPLQGAGVLAQAPAQDVAVEAEGERPLVVAAGGLLLARGVVGATHLIYEDGVVRQGVR